MANLSRQYCAYYGEATEIWKQHVIGVTVAAFDEYRDSVCQTLQKVAQDSSRPVPNGSAGGQAVNNQEEMSRNVQTAIENAQHLAQQRIADTLAQTFNAPPPIILSTVATGGSNSTNQSIQVNVPGKSTSSQGGVISSQNDGDSLDASIKSEVDSSSESECESDSDDEVVQVKEEPNEEENIAADGDGDFGEDERMDDHDNDDHHDLENQASGLGEQDGRDHEGAMFDEETDEDDCDYSEEQEDMSVVEDNEEGDENEEDSSDETNNYNETEEEEVPVGVAGPLTSAQERQGTRRVAKRQIVSDKASKRLRTGRDVVTVPLRIITKKLKCRVPGCKKIVKSKGSMNRHLLLKHQLKEFRCLVRGCHGKVSTSFSTQSQLNNHRRHVHGSLTEWTCKCAKEFKSYKKLSYHNWKYHEHGHFTCSKDGCPVKSTTTRAKLQFHQYKHSEVKYQCPVDDCGLSFKKRGNLDRHFLTHSGERSFPCPECGKSFKHKWNLTDHLRIHRKEKCFRCTWPQCTYSAIQQSGAITHIRTVHFKLPRTKKQQAAADIVDDRDARDFLAKN